MDWGKELKNWLSPFLDRLQNVAQRRWMPLYVQGLLGPGERKSVEAMAERVAPGNARPLQNFCRRRPGALRLWRSFWLKRPIGWLVGRTPSWWSTTRRF